MAMESGPNLSRKTSDKINSVNRGYYQVIVSADIFDQLVRKYSSEII